MAKKPGIHELLYATICYADVFDQPLALDQIHRWFIGKKISLNKLRRLVRMNTKGTKSRKRKFYYFLSGREKIIRSFAEKKQHAPKKIEIAISTSRLLSVIPSVQFIGITGALSMDMAGFDDDIDLFIIARNGTIFTTRFLATILTQIKGIRRKPNDKNIRNKICLNMYISDDNLSTSPDNRNLYTAHEIMQMKPIYDRGYIYNRFIEANSWVKKYLPNAWSLVSKKVQVFINDTKYKEGFIVTLIKLVESLIKHPQIMYMSGKRTTETVSDREIRFHPQDAKDWIRSELGKRLQKSKVPLDKIF